MYHQRNTEHRKDDEGSGNDDRNDARSARRIKSGSRGRTQLLRAASPADTAHRFGDRPPRLYGAGGQPLLYDADGQRFIDFNLGNGAAMLGHRHPALQAAMMEAVSAACSPAARRRSTPTRGDARRLHPERRTLPLLHRRRKRRCSRVASPAPTPAGRASSSSRGISTASTTPSCTIRKSRSPRPTRRRLAESAGMIGSPDDTLVLPWNDADRLRSGRSSARAARSPP